MYRLEKQFRFEAAHRLPHHDGKCKRLHGHSWVGRLVLMYHGVEHAGPKQGMTQDYYDIGQALQPFVEEFLDHHYLNETVSDNPTSERIARFVFDRLRPKLPALVAVEIDETCTTRCVYTPGRSYPDGPILPAENL